MAEGGRLTRRDRYMVFRWGQPVMTFCVRVLSLPAMNSRDGTADEWQENRAALSGNRLVIEILWVIGLGEEKPAFRHQPQVLDDKGR